MANSYTQLYIQLVFAVKRRQTLIHRDWEDHLYRYITGIVQDNKHKLIRINGMPDHIHIFIIYKPSQPLPQLVENIKTSSGKFIREMGYVKHGFNWQNGYGAFSYSKSHIEKVIQYIDNQKEHHKKKNFQQEYLQFLKMHEIEYDPKYLFEFNDEETSTIPPDNLPE